MVDPFFYNNDCYNTYLLPPVTFAMMNMITATTSTTNIMPVHTPALNIPSIAWQLLSIVMSANTENNCSFFIFAVFI